MTLASGGIPRRVLRSRLLGPYRVLLATPGARAFVLAGAVGRFPLSMLDLGAVLLVSRHTGSYGLAGAVSAMLAVSGSVAAPLVGALSDRRGQRPVLLVSLATHVLGVAGLVLAVLVGAPSWVYFLPAVPAGAGAPRLGAFVRARWTALVGGTPRLHTAFSLESAVDEFVFVVGPVLATVLALDVWSAGGLAASTALALTGSLMLATQRHTEPAPVPRTAGSRAGTALRTPGLRVVALSYLAVGVSFGTIEVSVVAFAQEHGSAVAAGPLLALWAVGSMVAGLLYGTVHWRRPLGQRFLIALAGFVLGTTLVALAPGIGSMAGAVVVCGLAIAPTLVAGIGLVEALVPASARTEGFTWPSTALGAGVAVGASVAGQVIDSSGGHRALLVAVAGGCLALAVAAAGARVLRVPPAE